MTKKLEQRPDRWSWVILLAVFCELMLCGIVQVSGIFNLVFLEEFGESRALTSWAGAMQAGLSDMGGKLVAMRTRCQQKMCGVLTCSGTIIHV